MKIQEAIKEIKSYADNSCGGLNEAFEMAINALEKQIPKKPYLDNDNGVYDKEHCPTCHRSLFPNDHHCRCGQTLNWSDHPTDKGGVQE